MSHDMQFYPLCVYIEILTEAYSLVSHTSPNTPWCYYSTITKVH